MIEPHYFLEIPLLTTSQPEQRKQLRLLVVDHLRGRSTCSGCPHSPRSPRRHRQRQLDCSSLDQVYDLCLGIPISSDPFDGRFCKCSQRCVEPVKVDVGNWIGFPWSLLPWIFHGPWDCCFPRTLWTWPWSKGGCGHPHRHWGLRLSHCRPVAFLLPYLQTVKSKVHLDLLLEKTSLPIDLPGCRLLEKQTPSFQFDNQVHHPLLREGCHMFSFPKSLTTLEPHWRIVNQEVAKWTSPPHTWAHLWIPQWSVCGLLGRSWSCGWGCRPSYPPTLLPLKSNLQIGFFKLDFMTGHIGFIWFVNLLDGAEERLLELLVLQLQFGAAPYAAQSGDHQFDSFQGTHPPWAFPGSGGLPSGRLCLRTANRHVVPTVAGVPAAIPWPGIPIFSCTHWCPSHQDGKLVWDAREGCSRALGRLKLHLCSQLHSSFWGSFLTYADCQIERYDHRTVCKKDWSFRCDVPSATVPLL